MNAAKVLDTIKSFKEPTESILNNVYVSGILKIIIILYAALAAPQLPTSISKYFHHPMIQVILFSLIAYTATKDIGISILLAIAFFISFSSYTKKLLGKVASSTRRMFVATKDKIKMPSFMIPKSSSDDESSAINFAKVVGHDEDSSVESGLAKDKKHRDSDVSDAALLDPYTSSMVPVTDMPGYKFTKA